LDEWGNMSKYDYERGVAITRAFGRTDYMYVYEVAPWAYRTLNDRIAVAIEESIGLDIEDDWTRELGKVDLARVLGAALSKTNPVFSQLTDGTDTYDAAKTGQLPSTLDTGALRVKEQSPLTSIQVSNFPADYPDSAVATKLGAGLPAALDGLSLKMKEQSPITTIDVTDDAARLLGEVDNLKKWGGTALTGRNISLDLANLDVALSTKARLQPWHQPNFVSRLFSYTVGEVVPHAYTTRWTYTVPANRCAMIALASVMLARDGTTANPGTAEAFIHIDSAARIEVMEVGVGTLGTTYSTTVGQSAVLSAGSTIEGKTRDSSVLGTHFFIVTANILEFNA
jgi:hypothetical protein